MKKFLFVLTALIIASMVLAACGTPATPTEAPVEPAAPEATEAPAPTEEAPVDANALPRNETLYFNGQQWGPVVCWNPYSRTATTHWVSFSRITPASSCSRPVLVQYARWPGVSFTGGWSLYLE